ncbi:DEBR0S1_07734g1_1 [Brettanomyces bruxellensis]|uniref:DEBR0S1_07734g1_1 n=1 Tax=Dekkera bruxellensis TaxID=5007 RepID=A0A7D9GWZ4_DEKBR|nr:DEBR0S1_07734g1_1 [Brettanomyces bruxellensis]
MHGIASNESAPAIISLNDQCVTHYSIFHYFKHYTIDDTVHNSIHSTTHDTIHNTTHDAIQDTIYYTGYYTQYYTQYRLHYQRAEYGDTDSCFVFTPCHTQFIIPISNCSSSNFPLPNTSSTSLFRSNFPTAEFPELHTFAGRIFLQLCQMQTKPRTSFHSKCPTHNYCTILGVPPERTHTKHTTIVIWLRVNLSKTQILFIHLPTFLKSV